MGLYHTIDDADEEEKSFIERLFSEFGMTKSTKQIVVGACSGFITGLLSARIGKNVALAFGGGIILLQFASEKKYISVNWDKVNKNVDKIADNVDVNIIENRKSLLEKLKYFTRMNTQLSSGFIGGFLIGVAS